MAVIETVPQGFGVLYDEANPSDSLLGDYWRKFFRLDLLVVNGFMRFFPIFSLIILNEVTLKQ